MAVQFDGVSRGYSRLGTRQSTAPVPVTGTTQSASTARISTPPVPLNYMARESTPPVPFQGTPYREPVPPGQGAMPYSAPAQRAPIGYNPPSGGSPLLNNPVGGPIAQNFQPYTPPAGGRVEYNSFSPEQQANARNKWLGGDSDYTAQVAEYDRALQRFIQRITGQISGFKQDAIDVTNSVNTNETNALNNLGEDFGARGLSYSGLFAKAKGQAQNRFNDTKANILKNRDRNVANANADLEEYKSENAIGKQNAQRASLLRMAQQQALLDAGAF